MDEAIFVHKLDELIEELSSARSGQRKMLVMRAKQGSERHSENNDVCRKSVHDSLDYLRVSIKYLLFDLEATRRENAYLRAILEEEK